MEKMVIPVEAFVVHHLFEDSEYFLQEAKKLEAKDPHVSRRYVRAAIITALTAVEAFVNTMLFLLEEGTDLDLAETAFVQEKRLELTEDGYFGVRGHRFSSLEEKIRFLHWRREGVGIPKGDAAWRSFIEAKRLRDELVHPKPGKVSYDKLTASAAESCLKASIELANALGFTMA
jgi:hypothetical protein